MCGGDVPAHPRYFEYHLRLDHYPDYPVANPANKIREICRGTWKDKVPKGKYKEYAERFESEMVDLEGDIVLKLPTIQETMNAYKDKAFINEKGRVNRELARMCYMIKSIKGKKNLTPIEIKMMIQKELTSADYIILKDEIGNLTDYGLRAGGSTICPKCHSKDAAFIALVDDRFLRPTLGDLREWKHDRSTRED